MDLFVQKEVSHDIDSINTKQNLTLTGHPKLRWGSKRSIVSVPNERVRIYSSHTHMWSTMGNSVSWLELTIWSDLHPLSCGYVGREVISFPSHLLQHSHPFYETSITYVLLVSSLYFGITYVLLVSGLYLGIAYVVLVSGLYLGITYVLLVFGLYLVSPMSC